MRRHWKSILWFGVCLIMLAVFFGLHAGDGRVIEEVTPQHAADRWETEEKPYAMASVFLAPGNAIPQDRMGEIFMKVEKSLVDSGVPSDTHPWFYAASYSMDTTLIHEDAYCTVEMTAVSGEYFRIHPLPLRTGWYIHEDNLMHDGVVLDRQTAWDLFYSDNVAGEFIEVDGYQYIVAAVVDLEQGRFNELAAADSRHAWVLADSPAFKDQDSGFTCMEMVLPQPVKDFAATTMKSALHEMIPDNQLITDNSGRFSLQNRWYVLQNLSSRSIANGKTIYPYWENAAKLTENHLALRLIPEMILLMIPSFSLLILLLWLNHRRNWGLHSIRDAIENAVEKKRLRDWNETHS